MELGVSGSVHAVSLTIVMYHYVRDLRHSRYPAIKGLSIDDFEGQLDYITRHYSVCSTREVIDAAQGRGALPDNACLLTFDDGLLDHFTVVFPRLVRRGLTASFYPPAVAAAQRTVLDTHKIHFILAAAVDHAGLAQRVFGLVDAYRNDADVPPAAALWEQWARPSRFDGPDVVFIKRVLQRGLPERVRAAITATLFDEYVGVGEAAFARELYMDVEQLRCLIASGMEVGGHGATHVWLDDLSPAGQREEIQRTAAFLGDVHGRDVVDWVMCYPFGAYTADTLVLLTGAGCALGLTTQVGTVCDLASPLTLPRLDTNDVPRYRDAPAVATAKIMIPQR
jgi:peptidoglycan/xylan/chitin deacetylase (PgdA/CDA1 family)